MPVSMAFPGLSFDSLRQVLSGVILHSYDSLLELLHIC